MMLCFVVLKFVKRHDRMVPDSTDPKKRKARNSETLFVPRWIRNASLCDFSPSFGFESHTELMCLDTFQCLHTFLLLKCISFEYHKTSISISLFSRFEKRNFFHQKQGVQCRTRSLCFQNSRKKIDRDNEIRPCTYLNRPMDFLLGTGYGQFTACMASWVILVFTRSISIAYVGFFGCFLKS